MTEDHLVLRKTPLDSSYRLITLVWSGWSFLCVFGHLLY